MYELVIIGAGVFGSAAAHAAVRSGAGPVLLIERNIGPAWEASAKSGGIVTELIWHEEDRGFVRRSRELYQEAVGLGGESELVRRPGMLTIGNRAVADLLAQRAADLRASGVPVEELSSGTVRARHPALDRLVDDLPCLFTPDDWHVNPTAYANAVLQDALAQGLEFRAGQSVTRLQPEDGYVTVLLEEGRVKARRVLVAAGTWARKLLRTAALDIPMRPYRVQLSSLETGAPHALPIVWNLDSDVYLVPDGETSLLAGDGTDLSEFDPDNYRKDGDPAFEEGIAEQLTALTSLSEQMSMRTSWAGLVGATPDRRPLLGPVTESIHVLCGDQGFGVMRGPALGELAARVVLGQAAVPPHLDPCRLPASDFPIHSGFTLEA